MPQSSPPDGLVRTLGLLDSAFIVIGIVVGSGIFLTTGLIARDLPSPALILLAWAVGGFLSIAGALTFAELGAAMPEAGGQYVYLRESYGQLPAFLFGWVTFLVYQTGSAAAVAAGFAEYFGYFVPALSRSRTLFSAGLAGIQIELNATQIVASLTVVLLTAINVRGVEAGTRVNNVLTGTKLLAIVGFIAVGLTLGDRHGRIPLEVDPAGVGLRDLLRGFGISLVAVLWAFDGWNNVNFAAGEIRDPARTLPRALFLGALTVTALYVLLNVTYLYALPVAEMSGEVRVAEKAATTMFGPLAASIVVAAVLVSTLGATNGTLLTGARVYYAMARDRLFFRAVGRIHPRDRTPHVSLWVQGAWTCALTLSGSYDQLFTYAMFSALLMYGAAAASVFTLRRKFPALPRPYRVWGYPLMPALFLAAIAVITVNTVIERPVESLAGLGLLAVGVPVYYFWRSRGERATRDVV